MPVVVRHSVFGSGELVYKSRWGLSLVCWNIRQASWVKQGWYDLSDEEFTVEGEEKNDGLRLLSSLRRKTTKKQR